LLGWPTVARGVRAIVASERARDYVAAAEALGARPVRVLLQPVDPYIRVRGATSVGGRKVRPEATYIAKRGGAGIVVTNVRGKRVYTITDTGREAVRFWARTAPVEVPVLKHGVLLRVWLGHLMGPERLREIVAEHRDNSERRRVEAEQDATAAHDETAWAYPEIALKWAERYHAAERDLAEQMLRDIDELAASGRAAKPARAEHSP